MPRGIPGAVLLAALGLVTADGPAPARDEAAELRLGGDGGAADGRGMKRPSSVSAGAGGRTRDPADGRGMKRPSSVSAGAGDGRAPGDPYEAYAEGRYEAALDGFVRQQVERPDDPAALINVGNAHYKTGDWEAAERAFSGAVLAADPAVRQQALYSLGNAAYRQGRLDEAVERYKAALELDPGDGDSKFNLEFVRDEVRRRHQQAQQQKREGQEGPSDEPQDGEGGGQEGAQGDREEPQEPPRPGEEPQPQGEQQGGQPEAGEADPNRADGDGDGLPDEVERSGENPTDPENPDTDGDGLADGREDRNADGRVDPGETDPNRADSDGDGLPDGEERPGEAASPGGAEAAAAEPAAGDPAAAGRPMEGEEGLSLEEAERYLAGLEEGRPRLRRELPRGRRTRAEKDW